MKDPEKRLEMFQTFENGWDGYDAPPISEDIITKAIALLCKLPSMPFVSASPSGTIQLEWENAGGYLEIEIGTGDSVRFATLYKASSDGWEESNCCYETIPHIVNDFLVNTLQRSL